MPHLRCFHQQRLISGLVTLTFFVLGGASLAAASEPSGTIQADELGESVSADDVVDVSVEVDGDLEPGQEVTLRGTAEVNEDVGESFRLLFELPAELEQHFEVQAAAGQDAPLAKRGAMDAGESRTLEVTVTLPDDDRTRDIVFRAIGRTEATLMNVSDSERIEVNPEGSVEVSTRGQKHGHPFLMLDLVADRRLKAGREIELEFTAETRSTIWTPFSMSVDLPSELEVVSGSPEQEVSPRLSEPSVDRWEAVDAGDKRVCLLGDGKPYCLHQYEDSQITWPHQVSSDGGWSAIAAGGDQVCAVREGELHCWALDDAGAEPERVSTHDDWEAVAMTEDRRCGVRSGALYCSEDMQTEGYGAEQRIGEKSDWSTLSAGHEHMCAIRSGELYCWGGGADTDNGSVFQEGQLGTGDRAPRDEPTRVGEASDWETVSAGTTHTCGIRDGDLYCWGGGRDGKLGLGDLAGRDRPKQVGSATDWQTVAAADRHTCGVRADRLYCWGHNAEGRVGLRDVERTLRPTPVSGHRDWETVSTAEAYSCGIRGGDLQCFGESDGGRRFQTDSERASDRDEEELVDGEDRAGRTEDGLGPWLSASAGVEHGCGIRKDSSSDEGDQTSTDGEGALLCWGDNESGQLGIGYGPGVPPPSRVDASIAVRTLEPAEAKPDSEPGDHPQPVVIAPPEGPTLKAGKARTLKLTVRHTRGGRKSADSGRRRHGTAH